MIFYSKMLYKEPSQSPGKYEKTSNSDITKIAFINPLYPPILGGLFNPGDTPQTLSSEESTPLSQQSVSGRV
jgi:hypothetical protein